MAPVDNRVGFLLKPNWYALVDYLFITFSDISPLDWDVTLYSSWVFLRFSCNSVAMNTLLLKMKSFQDYYRNIRKWSLKSQPLMIWQNNIYRTQVTTPFEFCSNCWIFVKVFALISFSCYIYGVVKFQTWISLNWYIYGFLQVVTWICQNWYIWI